MNLETIREQIKKTFGLGGTAEKIKYTSIVSLIIFFVTHGYFFLGKFANEDFHHSVLGYESRLSSGRWLGSIEMPYIVPWVIGLISAILMIITILLLVDLFYLNDKLTIFCTSALIITFPTLAYGYGYLFMAEIYSISLLMAVLAIWITTKYRYGLLLGSICLMISLAEYQSYIGVAMILCVIKIISMALQENLTFSQVIKQLTKFLIMGIVGVLLYFIGLKINLYLTGTELVSYKGMDNMGRINLLEIPHLITKTYSRFFMFFIGKEFFYANGVTRFFYVVSIITTLILIVKLIMREANKGKILLVLLMVTLLPVCANPVDFLAPETESNVLNIYAIVFVFLIPVVLVQQMKLSNLLLDFCIIAPIIYICMQNYYLSNVYYLKVSDYYEQTALFESRLLARIELTEGFNERMPIAIIADYKTDFYDIRQNEYEMIQADAGLRGRYIGINEREGDYFRTTFKSVNLINNITGVHLKKASAEDINKIIETDEYLRMGVYPEADSIAIIDDILVINMKQQWKIECEKTKDKLYFKVVPPPDVEWYETAWYLYKDNDKILVEWYAESDVFEFDLMERGEYQVRCFLRDENEELIYSLFSKKIIVE